MGQDEILNQINKRIKKRQAENQKIEEILKETGKNKLFISYGRQYPSVAFDDGSVQSISGYFKGKKEGRLVFMVNEAYYAELFKFYSPTHQYAKKAEGGWNITLLTEAIRSISIVHNNEIECVYKCE